MKVAIIGHGWVGRSMSDLFARKVDQLVIYDEPLMKEGNLTDAEVQDIKDKVNESDIAFICVPTPNNTKGALDTSIVEEVVKWCEAGLLVVRSTVNPGTCDKLMKETKKRIVMQPEYLGETPAHPMLNAGERQFMIIGGEAEDRRKLINLYQEVYNANINIRQVTALEAEIIKLSENRAISFKVGQCQELYDVCEAAGVDYYTIRDAVYGEDPRFNLWFTFVYPEKRGFNSKCIPKDVYAWQAWAESSGIDPVLTKALLAKNEEYIGG